MKIVGKLASLYCAFDYILNSSIEAAKKIFVCENFDFHVFMWLREVEERKFFIFTLRYSIVEKKTTMKRAASSKQLDDKSYSRSI